MNRKNIKSNKMVEKDEFFLLYDSHICRLCGEKNGNGSPLYVNSENDISILINMYLPLKIINDGKYPKWICPGCQLQVESTVDFFDLVLTGQENLRTILKKELSLWTARDDLVEENYDDDDKALFSSNDKLVLQMKGIEKPKRKRGRPPKPPPDILLAKQLAAEEEAIKNAERKKQEELEFQTTEEYEGRRKRNIKIPTRFQEVVQGKELERIYLETGVIDKSDVLSETDYYPLKEVIDYSDDIIGHLQDNNGQNLAELVYNSGYQSDNKSPGIHRKRKTRFICDVCNRSFIYEFRFLSHRSTHYGVRYECTQCEEQFDERIKLSNHQINTGHKGEGIIESIEESEIKQTKDFIENPIISSYGSETISSSPNQNIICKDESTYITEDTNIKEAAKVLYDLQNIDKIDSNQHPALMAGDVKMGQGFDTPLDLGSKTSFTLGTEDNPIATLQSSSEALQIIASADINHQTKKYNCQICNRSFNDLSTLNTHSQMIHTVDLEQSLPEIKSITETKYTCEKCNRIFKNPSSLLYHKESEHNQGRRFACSKCNKSFKHKQLLQRHHLVHTTDRPYPCDICGASFKTKPNLLNHLSTHSGIKKYECTICKQNFAHKTSLKLHYQWHSGSKPFSCKECGKSFTQNGNLQEHMRIHTGERPYECLYCDKKFKTSSQRRIHNKRHQKLKPFECNICQKSFLHIEIYRTHMRRHNNEKPFSCSYCSKAFSEQWALRKHIRIHTGEKPYNCPICNKAFADCSNLTKHRKIHDTQLNKPITGDVVPNHLTKNSLNETNENVLLTIIDRDKIPNTLKENQVIYVTYHPDNPNEHRTLEMPRQTQTIEQKIDSLTNIPLAGVLPDTSDAQIQNGHFIDDATDHFVHSNDVPSISHLQANARDDIQIELTDVSSVMQKFDTPPIDSGEIFDKYSQTIELITTDGRKLRLLAPYTDQLDLTSEFISMP